MFFVIRTTDKPDHGAMRAELRAIHLEYLTEQVGILVAAGGLLTDAGDAGAGGVLIVDVADRAAAETFINNDPFTKGGLFQSITIDRWRMAFFDRKKMI